MIDQALEFIGTRINEYLDHPGEPPLVLGNIAMHESGNETITGDIGNRIVLSLVSIVEEPALKNNNHFKLNNDRSIHYRNPTINLNLFILISANRNDYTIALRDLSDIVAFFQRQNVFTPENSPALPPKIKKLIFDMHSISFEQLNNLWGYLGGKYIPSVIYLMRLLSLQEDESTKAPVIENLGEIPKAV